MTAPPPSPRRRRILPAAALAALVLFVALIARFWHPVYGFTSLIQLDAPNDDLKIAAFRDLPVYVHRDNGGYDGLYYAQIAHDPTLRDPALPRAMDNFAYRARRILPPALAWVLGAGQPAWIIHTYPLLNVLAWFALAVLLFLRPLLLVRPVCHRGLRRGEPYRSGLTAGGPPRPSNSSAPRWVRTAQSRRGSASTAAAASRVYGSRRCSSSSAWPIPSSTCST